MELIKSKDRDRENKGLDVESFVRFLENLTIYQFVKEKGSTHVTMGEYLKGMLKKLAVG